MANTGNSFVWEGPVTDTYSDERYDLGTYREESGKGYRFVKYDNGTGNLTLAENDVLYYVNSSDHTVTKDVTDTDINHVAGVAVGAISDGEYGWMQTYGHDTVATDDGDDITDGDAIIGSGDGTCNSVAQDNAPTNKVLGWATAADDDSADTVAVFLVLR